MSTPFSRPAHLDLTSFSDLIFPRDEGLVFEQPYDTVNGSFVFPRTWPLTFREGSTINVSWTTAYDNINLYFYQQGKVAASVQLVTNLATSWYQWEVQAAETNLANPFVFRIVNAHGTAKERNSGGFYSTSWYLKRDNDEGRSATPSTSTISVSSSAAQSTMTTTPNPSPASATSAEILMSTAGDTSIGHTATPTSTVMTSTSTIGKTAIIGLTVGIAVAGACILAGIWYMLRRRRRHKIDILSAALQDTISSHDQSKPQLKAKVVSVYEASGHSSELQSVAPCYELPDKMYR